MASSLPSALGAEQLAQAPVAAARAAATLWRMPTRRLITLERFGPPEVMSWSDGALPERGPDDVLVAVEAIGVNFADTMVRRGEYRRDQPLDFTPGFEVAGTVVEGPADGPEPGSRVLGVHRERRRLRRPRRRPAVARLLGAPRDHLGRGRARSSFRA